MAKVKTYSVTVRMDEDSYKFILRESMNNQLGLSEYMRRIIKYFFLKQIRNNEKIFFQDQRKKDHKGQTV
jgi:hypothetical protein